MPAAPYLFAQTRCEEHLILIFLDPTLKGCMAQTFQDKSHLPVYIKIAPATLRRKRALVEDTLIHEFVHVVEMLYSYKLMKPDPKDCSQYAIAIERYLTQMMRNFEMSPGGVNPQGIPTTKPKARRPNGRAK